MESKKMKLKVAGSRKQNESYTKRPQSRRSRRSLIRVLAWLKRSNNRAPMFDVAFDLADDNSRSSKSRGAGHGRRFVAPPTAWDFVLKISF